MPNRITTWQPKHQQHVSDTIIFSISEECLHTLIYIIVTHTEFLTYTTTKVTSQSNVIKLRQYDLSNLSLTNWLHLLNLLNSTLVLMNNFFLSLSQYLNHHRVCCQLYHLNI